jgi:chromosome segregation ATPase
MTNETFDEMLNKKGSSGQIEFNHTDKQLNLVVQKDNTDEMSQTNDVKALRFVTLSYGNLCVKDEQRAPSYNKPIYVFYSNLSGGERSFTTLSLLLALGESLETPFRVMDEFDVFLDPIARKIALNTMVR